MAADARGNSRSQWLQGGLLLLDSALTPIYVGGDAPRILLYPDGGGSSSSGARLRERVATLKPPDESIRSWSTELISGQRRYRCQWIHLVARHQGATPPVVALVLERRVDVVGPSRLAALYNLTPREQEAVRYLLEGLGRDETASRLGITRNGVQAVLKRVMLKMDVTTRSGILGRYVGRSSDAFARTSFVESRDEPRPPAPTDRGPLKLGVGEH